MLIRLLTKTIPVLFTILFLLVCSSSFNNDKIAHENDATSHSKKKEEKIMKKNPLTKEEEYVIIHKGTEKPFVGEYTDFEGVGTYLCKQCNASLYTSKDKFHSGCGWPSFDDEIKGAVERVPDKDGRRTEIICANCKGHLGHVFLNEGFTPKNTRHCVNSISLKFIANNEQAITTQETAIFCGGCFWGVEYYFQNKKGVLQTQVGYIGGKKENPTYQEVSNNDTGHLEALKITFDSAIISYEELAKLFFEIHDPTQKNGQGNDIGEQYLSAIFYANDSQKEISEALIKHLESKGFKIATSLKPMAKFWEAEEYHQKYYNKTGKTPYCHHYTKRF